MNSRVPEDKLEALANKQLEEVRSRFLCFADEIQEIKEWEDKRERERISHLMNQAIENHLFVEKEMHQKETDGYYYKSFDVHERGLSVLEQLKACISSGEAFFEPISAPRPEQYSSQMKNGEDVSTEESETEVELAGVVPSVEKIAEDFSACDQATVEKIAKAFGAHDRAMEAVQRLEKTFPPEPEITSSGSCLKGTCACVQRADESCTPPIVAPGEPFSANDVMQLKKNIVRVMQLAGTQRVGHDAYWTLEQISVGLAKLYPFLGDETLTEAIEELSKEGMIIPLYGGRLVLSDDFAAKSVVTPLADTIIEILKSAKEQTGEYCGWTHNQLMFAVKRTSARLSEKVIREEMAALIDQGRIVSFEGKTTNYVAIDEETMERYKKKLIAIEHEPDPEAPAEEPAEKTVEKLAEPAPEPSKGNGEDNATWESVMKAVGFDSFKDVVAFSLLSHMRQEPKRLWRGYDIEGLYADAHDKIEMQDADGKPGQLQVALDFLIQIGLVEYIPRDTRPGIHEDRWGLTGLGSTGSH